MAESWLTPLGAYSLFGTPVDAFRLCLALGPLAIYLLVLGGFNLQRRPVLTTAGRDVLALGVALSGLMIIGPMELLMPRTLVMQMTWLPWMLWISFYWTLVVLIALVQSPRLTISNISREELRQVLAELAPRLDPHAVWLGDTLHLPSLDVQLHIDEFAMMRNVSLTAIGRRQSFQGWRTLENALDAALASKEVQPNPRGISLVMIGSIILLATAIKWFSNPQEVAQSFTEMIGW